MQHTLKERVVKFALLHSPLINLSSIDGLHYWSFNSFTFLKSFSHIAARGLLCQTLDCSFRSNNLKLALGYLLVSRNSTYHADFETMPLDSQLFKGLHLGRNKNSWSVIIVEANLSDEVSRVTWVSSLGLRFHLEDGHVSSKGNNYLCRRALVSADSSVVARPLAYDCK